MYKFSHIYGRLKKISKKKLFGGLGVLLVGTFLFIGVYLNQESSGLLDPHRQAQKIFESCRSHTPVSTCYIHEFANLTKKQSTQNTIETLLSLQKIDDSAYNCHRIAHGISVAAVSNNPQKWEEFVSSLKYPDMCYGALIHGVLETVYKNNSTTFSLTAENIDRICQKIGFIVTSDTGESTCAHATGHLILANKKNDVGNSIQLCEQLSQKFQSKCKSGVFMEHIMPLDSMMDGEIHTINSINSDTVAKYEDLCRQFSGDTELSCWREAAFIYVNIADSEPDQIFKLCARAGRKEHVNSCIQYAVSLMVRLGLTSSEDLVAVCEPYKEDEKLFSKCVGNLQLQFIEAAQDNFSRADDFCQNHYFEFKPDCCSYLHNKREESATGINKNGAIDTCQLDVN